MSLFVSKTETFEISVKYFDVTLKSGRKTVHIINEENPRDKEWMEKHPDLVREISTIWMQPTWKQNYDLLRKCNVFDLQTGTKNTDNYLYRAACLETFMKNWDVVDEKGAQVPINKETLEALEPSIANTLINEFLDWNAITEQDLGK